MRNLLPGYYTPADSDFKKLWDEGIFIFDTSVLLNLHRYPTSARDELLQLLDSLKDRVWIPFHVALEYQRNRPTVISEQKRKFSETRNAALKAMSNMETEFANLQLKDRHSIINPDLLIQEVRNAIKKFNEELESLEGAQPDVNDEDPIRDRIGSIFLDKIGPSPTKEFIDNVHKDGIERIKNKIPPGFADEKKGDSTFDTFSHDGINYQTKFGDLIIWSQILEKSKLLPNTPIILVTDDRKDDWWWTVESLGKKHLGPRPELIDEISKSGGTKLFYMYKSPGFLKYAQQYVKADISQSSIEQVADISSSSLTYTSQTPSLTTSEMHEIIANWALSEKILKNIDVKIPSFCDICGIDNLGNKVGVEIIRQNANRPTAPRVESAIRSIYEDLDDGSIDRSEIVIILNGTRIGNGLISGINKLMPKLRSNITITIGALRTERTGENSEFVPLKRMTNIA